MHHRITDDIEKGTRTVQFTEDPRARWTWTQHFQYNYPEVSSKAWPQVSAVQKEGLSNYKRIGR